jgi:phage gp29-like protein
MAQLLGPDGLPIPPRALTGDVAGAQMVGLRPAVIATPLGPLTPDIIGNLMAQADQGDSLAWQTLAEFIERRDLHYLGVLNTRKRVISQLPITVTPASDDPKHVAHADHVRAWVERGILRRSLYDQMDALAKGYSVHEIEWHCAAGNYYPETLTFRPQRWFDISYEDGETLLIRDDGPTPAKPSVPDGIPQYAFKDVPLYKFVVHRHPSWSGLTINAGLTRACVWAVMFKLFTDRDWALFVQGYGLPLRIGKFGPEASDDDRRILFRAVSDIAGSAAAIIPKSMEIDFVEPKHGAGSNDIHERRQRYLNEEMSKAVLGQTGTTESKQGAHASGQVHRQVQDDIERADAGMLSFTATAQVAVPMVSFSFGPQDRYPIILIGRPDEPPLAELISAIQWACPQGWLVPAQDLYDRFGMSPPEEGDMVVGTRAQPQPVQPAHALPAEALAPRAMPAHVPPPTIATPRAGEVPDPTQVPQRMEEPSAHAALHARLRRLLSAHARSDGPQVVTMLTDSLARDAQAALNAMIAPARDVVMHARDLHDLAERLATLKLPEDAFAMAMAQGMAVANLAGEFEILEQMTDHG